MSLCEQWLANKTKNPNTGRTIKPTGKVYKDLQQKCEPQNISQQPLRQKKTKPPEISDADCNKWFNTFYSINPKTNREIVYNKPTYKKLLKRCGEKPVNNSIYDPFDVISYFNSFLKYIGSLQYFHYNNIDKNKRFVVNPPETDEAYENMWIPLHDLLMSEIVAINNAINGVLRQGIKTFPSEAEHILKSNINALKLSIKWLNDRLDPEIPLNVNWKQKPKSRKATVSERQKKAVEALLSESLEEKAPLIEPLEEKAPLIEPLEEKAPLIETITIKEPKTFTDYAWYPQPKSSTIKYIESKLPGSIIDYQYNIIKSETPKKYLTPEELKTRLQPGRGYEV